MERLWELTMNSEFCVIPELSNNKTTFYIPLFLFLISKLKMHVLAVLSLHLGRQKPHYLCCCVTKKLVQWLPFRPFPITLKHFWLGKLLTTTMLITWDLKATSHIGFKGHKYVLREIIFQIWQNIYTPSLLVGIPWESSNIKIIECFKPFERKLTGKNTMYFEIRVMRCFQPL